MFRLRQACRFLSVSRIRVADSGLDRYLMKKSGSKRVSETQAALKGGKKMLDKLNARRKRFYDQHNFNV